MPAKPAEQDLDEVALDPAKPEQTVQIGASLPAEEKQRIIEFLKKNISCFAWSHEDKVGIERW